MSAFVTRTENDLRQEPHRGKIEKPVSKGVQILTVLATMVDCKSYREFRHEQKAEFAFLFGVTLQLFKFPDALARMGSHGA